jgi:hypothetical protein
MKLRPWCNLCAARSSGPEQSDARSMDYRFTPGRALSVLAIPKTLSQPTSRSLVAWRFTSCARLRQRSESCANAWPCRLPSRAPHLNQAFPNGNNTRNACPQIQPPAMPAIARPELARVPTMPVMIGSCLRESMLSQHSCCRRKSPKAGAQDETGA